MQPFYTFLNIALLWTNTWATFKTLNRRSAVTSGQRSSRFQHKTKREMKTCLSTWVVWVAWRMLERVVDTTIGVVIPFLHEMKCLFLFLLIITRPWGTEPLVLHVLRPAIRPYTGIIDTSLHWIELSGDFLFLLLLLPYHSLVSWWNSSPHAPKESQDTRKDEIGPPEMLPPDESQPIERTTPEIPLLNESQPVERVPTPPSKPTANPVIEPVATAAKEAIEAHRKEQEQQAEEEAKLKDLQDLSSKAKMAHLHRVSKPSLPLPSKRGSVPPPSHAAPRQGTTPSSSDLPNSALNLPLNRGGNVRNVPRAPMKRPQVIPARPVAPPIANRESSAPSSSDGPTHSSIYPTASLAMPVPVRASRVPARPAVHRNASLPIERPSNPPPEIPSVVIPLSTQTLPRPPRTRPPPGLEGARSLGLQSTDTLVTTSSMSTVAVDEFGVSGHRREAADDETVSGSSQSQLRSRSQRSGSGSTVTNDGGRGGNQTWEDFITALERQNQAAIHPRGTSAPGPNGTTLPNDKNMEVSVEDIIVTRGNQEMVQRIAVMKKEVDEKLQRINERTSKGGIGSSAKGDTTTRRKVPERTHGTVGSRVKALEKMQADQQPHGQKRPRKAQGSAPAMKRAEESSTSADEGDRRPLPKRKKVELVEDTEMDDATITSSIKGSKPVANIRPTRAAASKAKEKVMAVSTVGRAKSTRAATRPPTEVVIPSGAMRTRARRGPAQ